MYFRDPSAENNGLMDGIIDLGLVSKVNIIIGEVWSKPLAEANYGPYKFMTFTVQPNC